tara:strand:- start:7 stop:378 length:372 start_codon:yes stop_codon:yes gene_type:complete
MTQESKNLLISIPKEQLDVMMEDADEAVEFSKYVIDLHHDKESDVFYSEQDLSLLFEYYAANLKLSTIINELFKYNPVKDFRDDGIVEVVLKKEDTAVLETCVLAKHYLSKSLKLANVSTKKH